MIRIDFDNQTISDKLYRRIDTMIDPGLEHDWLAALDIVDAKLGREMHEVVYNATMALLIAREEAGITLGIELATGPALWLLEPLPPPPTDEQVEAWKQEREARKQERRPWPVVV